MSRLGEGRGSTFNHPLGFGVYIRRQLIETVLQVLLMSGLYKSTRTNQHAGKQEGLADRNGIDGAGL